MNIAEIRNFLHHHGAEAYVVTHGNRFIGQDILPQENKIKELCGFSGSAGMMVITTDQAYLLVDGRYELQARLETKAQDISVVDVSPRLKSACDILREKGITKVVYDAWNHSVAEMEFVKRRYTDITFIAQENMLSFTNQSKVEVLLRDDCYSGMSREKKCTFIADILKERGCDYYLFTSADSVSWLLNIYAADLPYSPVVRTYALISNTGKAVLIGGNLITDEFEVWSWQTFIEKLQNQNHAKILYDAHTTPEILKYSFSENVKLIKAPDICQEMKAQKNQTELQGMINSHLRDGVALSKFLCWLENNWRGLTELDVVEKLHEFRAAQKDFFSESFATIAGSAHHAAIVHYQPDKTDNIPLRENTLLLLDSGGQYFDGTTDVTRTIVLGEPSKEMIDDFTTVLKAHIALATAFFPQNTSGIKLDALARAPLWKRGLDYKHGTGHGVACFGNVHEGPISISVSTSDYGFKEHMVVSIEPGIYRDGQYGIRIENLAYTEVKYTTDDVVYLNFCHLTKVPIDKKLIDKYLLTEEERAWLNAYHQCVYEQLAPYMNENEKLWLKDVCSPL